MRDVSKFFLGNIVDTCAVWNILSSPRLYAAARQSNCQFAVTRVVLYECLIKPRTKDDERQRELQRRLRRERDAGRFSDVPLTLEDLQDVALLHARRRLGHGELSSIAFAKRTAVALLIDDRGGTKLGEHVLGFRRVQTTPHLLGWLVFGAVLGDNDVNHVIREHLEVGGDLRVPLELMYNEAMRCRTLAGSAAREPG